MNKLLGKTIVNPLFNDEVTYVHTAAESNGEKTVLDILLHPKGKGPGVHYHLSFSETFKVTEGELMIRLGKERILLKEGEVKTAEIRQLHNFWSQSDKPTRFRVTIKPAHEGFENTLAVSYGLAVDGHFTKSGRPKKFSHMAILATMSDTNAPGFFSLIFTLLRAKAKKENTRKIRKELIEKYCQ